MKFVHQTHMRTLGVCVALSAFACSGDDGSPSASSSSSSNDAAATEDATGDPTGDPTADPTADSTGNATTDPSADSSSTADNGGQSTGATEDLDMTPEDFACLLDWPRVRRFRVTNLLGHEDETMAVADNPDGGVYPVGTVIQLIPNEAMVKRAQGWSEETDDWEFFSLATSAAGTEIEDRGTTDTINAFGGNCFNCHAKAAPQWDLVCEQDHGCDPIPIPEATINMLQENDPRCR